MEGQGAADAAFDTAISMEFADCEGKTTQEERRTFINASTKIVTPLVYKAMEATGMPRKVRKAHEEI